MVLNRTPEHVRMLEKKVKEQAEQIKRLKELLENYGNHIPDCDLLLYGTKPCSCGYEQTLKAATPQENEL